VRLEPGDVVILASDGLLDNLWDEQLLAAAAAATASAGPALGVAAGPAAAAAAAGVAEQLAAGLAGTALRVAQVRALACYLQSRPHSGAVSGGTMRAALVRLRWWLVIGYPGCAPRPRPTGPRGPFALGRGAG
jgi:hypothetical protein